MKEPILFWQNERSKRQKIRIWSAIYILTWILIGWILSSIFPVPNFSSAGIQKSFFTAFSVICFLIASAKRNFLFPFVAMKGASFGFVFRTLLLAEDCIALCLCLLVKDIIQLALVLRITSVRFHPLFDPKEDQLFYGLYLLYCIGIYGLMDYLYSYLISFF